MAPMISWNNTLAGVCVAVCACACVLCVCVVRVRVCVCMCVCLCASVHFVRCVCVCACRVADEGVLDIVGMQMSTAPAGSLATGLEGEIERIRVQKRDEEDRRLGRIRKRQQVFSRKPILGLEKVTPTAGVGQSDSVGALPSVQLPSVGPPGTGEFDTRVEVSREMQAKLDAYIQSQVHPLLLLRV